MKTKLISKYLFINFIVSISLSVQCQEIKKDSVAPKTQKYGLRVGVDLYRLTKNFYDKSYRGVEFVGDYRLTDSYFLAAELGNENKITDDTRLNFTTKGTYLKVGFDYNSYENWLNMQNVLSIGLRYGGSAFSQELNSYKIYSTNQYLQENTAIISGQKFDGLSAQWIEVVAGMKAEVLHNIFVGFSFRVNYLITNSKPDNFDNLYIPGFNRTYDGSFGSGFNYSVSYLLPIYKKSKKVAVDTEKNKIKK